MVEVCSAPTEPFEEDEASGVGWKAAYAYAIEMLLHDYTVMHEAKRLNNEVTYTLGVFQLASRMFFTAYDPERSCRHYVSIPTTEINKLLSPNSFETTTPGWTAPPGNFYDRPDAALGTCL